MAVSPNQSENRYTYGHFAEYAKYFASNADQSARNRATDYINHILAGRHRGNSDSVDSGDGVVYEPSLIDWLPAFIYINIGLCTCLLYNINFVYIFLTTSNIILIATQLIAHWQLPRSPWTLWFVATNIVKTLAFFTAGAVVLRPELATTLRYPLRIMWLIVFVLFVVAINDRIRELRHSIQMKRWIYDNREGEL